MLKKGCLVVGLGFLALVVAFILDPNKPKTKPEICGAAYEVSQGTGGRVTPQEAAERVCGDRPREAFDAARKERYGE